MMSLFVGLVHIARRRIARQHIARPHCKMASYYFYNASKGYKTIRFISKKALACNCHEKYHFFFMKHTVSWSITCHKVSNWKVGLKNEQLLKILATWRFPLYLAQIEFGQKYREQNIFSQYMNNLSYDEKTQLLLKKTRITQSLKHEINFLNYVVKLTAPN